MSGTDMGRQLPLRERELTPAEQHLGDRLAALIDGELGHDARERVLAHLATCRNCKAEADAQRRVKNVFADTAPPPPSDGLLARLQGLPAEDPLDPRERTSADDEDRFDGRGGGGHSPWTFDYLRGGRGSSALSPDRGFRIHEPDRVSWRSRRFAFAAAGAVSLAALALGGGLGSGSMAGSSPAAAKGDSQGASASSVRTSTAASGAERDRRRRDGGAGASEERAGGAQSVSTTSAGTAGAPVKAGRDAAFHRAAPWAAPSAPPAAKSERERDYPLLRNALFASTPSSALPGVTYNSYGTEPRESAPRSSPAGTAASPRG